MSNTLKTGQKDFGSKTLKKLSSHMSSLKSLSAVPVPNKLCSSMSELDTYSTSSCQFFHSKLDLTLNLASSLATSLKSQRSAQEIQGAKISKLLKLSRNKLALEIDKLTYNREELPQLVLTTAEEKVVEIKQELVSMEKTRKRNCEKARRDFFEQFQSIKYTVDKESRSRACQTELIIDQIEREVKVLDLEIKKNSEERKIRGDILIGELERCESELDQEMSEERSKRVEIQNKIIELFEEACKKVAFKK